LSFDFKIGEPSEAYLELYKKYKTVKKVLSFEEEFRCSRFL